MAQFLEKMVKIYAWGTMLTKTQTLVLDSLTHIIHKQNHIKVIDKHMNCSQVVLVEVHLRLNNTKFIKSKIFDCNLNQFFLNFWIECLTLSIFAFFKCLILSKLF